MRSPPKVQNRPDCHNCTDLRLSLHPLHPAGECRISMLVVHVVIHINHSFIHSQALYLNRQADSLLQAEEEEEEKVGKVGKG